MAERLPKCLLRREIWNQPHSRHNFRGRVRLTILKPGPRKDRQALAEALEYLPVVNCHAKRP